MAESLPSAIMLFAACAVVIALAGTFMSTLADRLADRTGMGEALVGMLLLAGATSLPDFAATLSAAVDGRASLAMSNVMGSMAVNLVFLVVGDLAYRRANLEHAAASAPNLMQAALLVGLLAIPLIASTTPNVDFLGVHPATPLLLAACIFGIRLVRHSNDAPMWRPQQTAQTVVDRPEKAPRGETLARLWVGFGALTTLTAIAGWVLMDAAKVLVDHTALAENQAGGVLTAVATSLPELVTTIAAVRRGALTLAVANIFGTNCFNTIVIAAADVGYREGSIYHAIPAAEFGWGLVTILMTSILLLGMLRRETHGVGNIGFESAGILLLYAGALALVFA